MIDSVELPKGWALTKLGELTEPSSEKVKPQEIERLPYIGLEHIEKDTGKLLEHGYSNEVRSTKSIFNPGDLLYGKLRPYLNKVLVVDFKGVCSTDILVFPKRPHVDNKFLQYRLLFGDFVRYANRNVSGVQHPRVRANTLAEFTLALPPLPEQHRIVEKIEELFTQLDAGMAELQKAKAQLKRYRQAVLKAAVEGELTREWREAHKGELEPVSDLLERILAERRAKWEAEANKDKYREPALPNTDGLPELPKSWGWTYIGPLLETKRDGMKTGPFGSLLKKHEHREKGIPVIGIENIGVMKYIPGSKIHITRKKAEQLEKYDVQEGDLIISRSGTVGEVMVIPEGLGEARLSTNVMRVTLTPAGMRPMFFVFLFNGSPFVLNQVSDLCKGSTRDFLNQRILRSIAFPIAPIAEQDRIIQSVERRLSVADEIEKELDQALVRAEHLRQSILKRAFAGELVSQDPNNEPASELAERIKKKIDYKKLETLQQ